MTEPSLPEESIFAQALEIDSPAERAAFLDRACGQNPALRAEVEALPCGAARRAPPGAPPGYREVRNSPDHIALLHGRRLRSRGRSCAPSAQGAEVVRCWSTQVNRRTAKEQTC